MISSLVTTRRPTVENVILDLDETLISAIEVGALQSDRTKAAEFQKRKDLFTYHVMDNDYIITERPGVQDFLDFVFAHFNVSVWTAASKEYALFVVDKVVLRNSPRRKLDYFLFAEHCDASQEKSGCLKQLNQLFHLPQYNPQNTVIIDDNRNVYETQTNLVLPIRPFRFFGKHSEADDRLSKIRDKLIEYGRLPNTKNPGDRVEIKDHGLQSSLCGNVAGPNHGERAADRSAPSRKPSPPSPTRAVAPRSPTPAKTGAVDGAQLPRVGVRAQRVHPGHGNPARTTRDQV
jgi:hypothetical protein